VTVADGAEQFVVEELGALEHEAFMPEEQCPGTEEVFLECPVVQEC
jgi:hypothetical protein